MEKLVTLKLKGDFNRGFDATLKIKQGNTDLAEIDGKLPPNPEIISTFKKWQEAFEIRVTTEVTRGFKKVKAETTNFSCTDLANQLKEQLNIWLKSADAGWQDIRDCLQQNLHPNEETRLIIKTENPLLRRLPLSVWELFDDQHFHAEIALSPSQFRFSEFSPSKSKKVRILAVLGNSTIEGSTIDTDFDKRQFQELEKQGAKVELLSQPTAKKLREYLWDDGGWDIFFFAGHSNSNADGTIGAIELNENETLSINNFREALKAARERGLQIAVFNSCDGLGLANSLVELNLPQIIVMREKVPDEVAREFLRDFLTAFARKNCSLYTAVGEGRRKLENFEAKYPGVKWLPVIAQHPAATPPTWDRLRGRSGGRIGGGDWTREGLLTRQEFKNRRDLLKQVKSEVEGRLRQSLHSRMGALINLEKEAQPEQVRRIWDVDVKIGDRPQMPLSRETEMIEVFDDEDVAGRLLILGAPGSGKTTTMLELAAQLTRRAEDDPKEPMPVLFNLSSWKDDKQPISEWLVGELNLKYGARKDIGKNWVEGRRLLPMLDGLDELESRRQELCVGAINDLLRGECRPGFLVVCSRLEEYELYRSRLLLNGAVCLQPLTEVQIEGYLEECQRPGLWSTIREDAALLELVRTPLLLSMTVVAQISMAEWGELGSSEERLGYLLDAYVVRMLGEEIKSRVYVGAKVPSARQTRFWLIWVAQQIERESQTEFLIEKMQPDLLINWRHKLIYGVILGLIYGVIYDLIYLLTFGLIVGLIFVLISGLISGLMLGLTYGLTCKQIKIAETISFSINKYFYRLKENMIYFLIFGLMLGLISWLIYGIIFYGVIVVLISWLIYWLFQSMIGAEIETKIKVNQGIVNSLSNTRYLLIITLPIVIAFIILLNLTEPGVIKATFPLLAFLLPTAVILSFGQPAIKHFSLRLVLYFTGKIPWNYARFLDYATERTILQRVGGGYRFIHRLLQEHFASLGK